MFNTYRVRLNRLGTVKGHSRDDQVAYVLWDGTKNTQAFARTFLDEVIIPEYPWPNATGIIKPNRSDMLFYDHQRKVANSELR